MKSAALACACLLPLLTACAGSVPASAPTSTAPATPTAAGLPSPAAVKSSPVASPSPAAKASPIASPTTAPVSAPKASALPTVERSRTTNDPSFLTRIDLDLEFETAVTSSAELERVVDGLLGLDGVVYARADAQHLSLRYDSQRVLPGRIRDRMRELGHPATAGVDVQNPGDAAD